MPNPTFTSAHLRPLRLHMQDCGTPRRLTHSGPMTDQDRDCLVLGLLAIAPSHCELWTTTITPAGVALLQAVDAVLDDLSTHALVDSDGAIVQLGTSDAMTSELAAYPEPTLARVAEVPATARIGDPA